MKKTLLTLFALLATVVAQADNEMLYGIYQGSGTLTGIGTKKAETYDVAMHLTDPYLVGMEVRGMKVPINTSAKNTTDYKAWITTELKVDNNVNVPDILSVDFTPDGKWADVTFDTPYVITEGGIYVGYSFTVSSVDTDNSNDANQIPLMTISGADLSGLYVHTSRSVRKWTEFEQTSYFTAKNAFAFVVRLSGSKVKTRAAAFVAPDDLNAYSLTGKSVKVPLTILNHGVEAITSLEYTIEVNGQTTERTTRVSIAGQYYGSQGTLNATVPAVSEAGMKPITFRITKVNGEANEDDDPETVYTVAYLDAYPKHKPLMEEYTGSWCGWCPRGMVAMEAMTEIYGDDFVGVAWHNGDPMQITLNYPNEVNGFPHFYLDRVIDGDPYGGTGGGTLGIQNDWKSRSKVLAPATIELSALWTDDNETAIRVTSTTQFIRDFRNSPYLMSYMLVADDLSGSGKSWAQSNNYSGNSSYANDKYLGPLTKLPGTITDMKFKDVVIFVSSPGNTAIENSLPTSVKAAEPVTHEYIIDISENGLVQDKTKLRVVAVLLNTQTGEVVQAEKAKVTDTTALSEVGNKQSSTSQYFDLSGRRVSSLGRGIYIKSTTYSDGSVRTSKVRR
jgi:hypothetical protein